MHSARATVHPKGYLEPGARTKDDTILMHSREMSSKVVFALFISTVFGALCASQADAKPRRAKPSITASVSRTTITLSSSVQVTGRVRGMNSRPRVVLQQLVGRSWKWLESSAAQRRGGRRRDVSADGSFRLTVRPARAGLMRLRARATADGKVVVSRTLQLRVRSGPAEPSPTPPVPPLPLPFPASPPEQTDVVAPDTAIDSGPTGRVPAGAVEFSFSATEAMSGFECSLDGAAFAQCRSPLSVGTLAPGRHQLRVRAIDAAHNVDPTPASRDWASVVPRIDLCGDVSSDRTLSGDEAKVYVITCDITVGAGAVLRVEPGTIIKAQQGTVMAVNGTLDIAGSSSDPAVFTSFADDDAGGDTNGDGDPVSGIPAVERLLELGDGSTTRIANAVFRNASDSAIYAQGSAATTSLVVRDSRFESPVQLTHLSPVLERNVFTAGLAIAGLDPSGVALVGADANVFVGGQSFGGS
jgi:hypothetical protein